MSCDNNISNKMFSNSVTDIVTNPEKYNNQTFSIYGVVEESYSLLGKSYFILADGENTIKCVANEYSPSPNTNVKLNGKLEIICRFNEASSLLFIVEK